MAKLLQVSTPNPARKTLFGLVKLGIDSLWVKCPSMVQSMVGSPAGVGVDSLILNSQNSTLIHACVGEKKSYDPRACPWGILNQKQKVEMADEITTFLVCYNLRSTRKYLFPLTFLSAFPPNGKMSFTRIKTLLSCEDRS